MGSIFNDLAGIDIAAPVWWFIAYAIFVALNIIGVDATCKFTIFITFRALGILDVCWIGAIPHFSLDHALNIEPEGDNGRWFPKGYGGIAASLPFAIWFYLAIAQLPLSAEEAPDPKRDIPKCLLSALLTLITPSILTRFP